MQSTRIVDVKLLIAEADVDYALYSQTVQLRRALLRRHGFN